MSEKIRFFRLMQHLPRKRGRGGLPLFREGQREGRKNASKRQSERTKDGGSPSDFLNDRATCVFRNSRRVVVSYIFFKPLFSLLSNFYGELNEQSKLH